MPPLDTSGDQLSDFEFWSMRRFYWPIALYALWLMIRYRGITLPTAANPSFPGGGFSGESQIGDPRPRLQHRLPTMSLPSSRSTARSSPDDVIA